MITHDSPRAARARTVWEPIKPEPPVTRIMEPFHQRSIPSAYLTISLRIGLAHVKTGRLRTRFNPRAQRGARLSAQARAPRTWGGHRRRTRTVRNPQP